MCNAAVRELLTFTSACATQIMLGLAFSTSIINHVKRWIIPLFCISFKTYSSFHWFISYCRWYIRRCLCSISWVSACFGNASFLTQIQQSPLMLPWQYIHYSCGFKSMTSFGVKSQSVFVRVFLAISDISLLVSAHRQLHNSLPVPFDKIQILPALAAWSAKAIYISCPILCLIAYITIIVKINFLWVFFNYNKNFTGNYIIFCVL